VAKIDGTDLDVFGLCLGGNIFGWTADREESFAVLDAYVDAGGNFLDTADVYSAWVPGNQGGESEQVIGEWLAARGNRDRIVLATKVGSDGGLSADNVRAKTEASLRRLGTDYIDLLYAHRDDKQTPPEETLTAFGELVSAGKARYIAASNYSAARLAEALATSEREGLPRYVALQPHYNLVERRYEDKLAELCAREGLACVPYYALAKGFLTGKYRPKGPEAETRRGAAMSGTAYLEHGRAVAVLEALDQIAADRAVPVASVALAWLDAQPTVVAPVASARTPAQLAELLPSVSLRLNDDELARLAA
jgi:aryl-alcohol dehydrogenase-like predicted oxidoreductase